MSAIAAVGSLSRDVVAGAEPRPGGAVFYAARAYARLGADAMVVARCAAEDVESLVPPLEAFGLPVVLGRSSATSAFAFHYEAEHRVMEVQAIGDPWTVADIRGWADAALRDAEWVQVGALLRTDFDVTALGALAAGRSLLLDGQGLARRARIGPLLRDADVDPEIFPLLRVLKLNEDEAAILAGGISPERVRALGVPEVVLTLGSAGSVVVTDEHAERIAAHAVANVKDPTGAGDSFSAGYLHARAAGAHPVEAARAASELAAAMLAGPR